MHISEELAKNTDRVTVETQFGLVTGGRADNKAIVFLEIPYALPPKRFENPVALPPAYKYENKEYIYESLYAAQPTNDGQAAGIPFEDKVGLGKPTENPLFLNIVMPPTFNSSKGPAKFPVKTYIHGGFLQFGSPHGLSAQAQFVAAARSEIYVNIGYRLSAFGFLACDSPHIDGNFGFKDQWLALEWIKANISAFGGDPDNIQLTGLSAGAHSVHQILHHASRLPDGQKAPFRSARLESNAMVLAPKTPAELRTQLQALCTALSIDLTSPDVLTIIKDPIKTPWQSITSAIDAEKLGNLGTFRGCLDGTWLPADPEPMAWQRSGGFAQGLQRVGIQSVVVGDLKDEWYLYAMAHPIRTPEDVRNNLLRYYPEKLSDALLGLYSPLSTSASQEECFERFGKVLSDGQVHLPVRLLSRDLISSSFPVLRYEIRWTPEQVRERTRGYVTHATDRVLWFLREPDLTDTQKSIALSWLSAVDNELGKFETVGKTTKNVEEVLTLCDDRTIGWEVDKRYDEIMKLAKVVL